MLIKLYSLRMSKKCVRLSKENAQETWRCLCIRTLNVKFNKFFYQILTIKKNVEKKQNFNVLLLNKYLINNDLISKQVQNNFTAISN